jgi:hypothetical protein
MYWKVKPLLHRLDDFYFYHFFQSAVEPMQVDAPPEDNDNNEEEPYVVENSSLVGCMILQTDY